MGQELERSLNIIDTESVYLVDLLKEELALREATRVVAEARAKYDIAKSKYTALRDLTTAFIGRSPYSSGFEWPEYILDEFQQDGLAIGKFRFTGMTYGDAITMVLREKGTPMKRDAIAKTLVEGGFGMGDDGLAKVDLRGLNAALMKTSGIIKREDGTYQYDLPW